MSTPICQNQIVPLSAGNLIHEPIEVVAIESDGRSSDDSARSRPTRVHMMESFRALREKRASSEESEIVLEEIITDTSPDSLMSDVNGMICSEHDLCR